jgi:hypothetical protein
LPLAYLYSFARYGSEWLSLCCYHRDRQQISPKNSHDLRHSSKRLSSRFLSGLLYCTQQSATEGTGPVPDADSKSNNNYEQASQPNGPKRMPQTSRKGGLRSIAHSLALSFGAIHRVLAPASYETGNAGYKHDDRTCCKSKLPHVRVVKQNRRDKGADNRAKNDEEHCV